MKHILNPIYFLSLALVLFSCKKDDDTPGAGGNNEETELITTVRVVLTDNAGGVSTFSFADTDGVGGNDPVIDTIKLDFDKAPYTGSLQFLDESGENAVDITEEVESEGTEHIVCYTPSTGALSIAITDKDANNLALGLKTSWTLSDAGSGDLRIRLKHQPGSKNGTCNPGATDVDLSFPLEIN